MKKLCIIQTGFIGDAICAVPVAAAIKKQQTDSEIHMVIQPASAEIISCSQAVDKLIIYDKRKKHHGIQGFMRFVNKLRREHYDAILVLHKSMRSGIAAYLSGCCIRTGYNLGTPLFYSHTVEYTAQHEIDRNLSHLSKIGFNTDFQGFSMQLPEKAVMFIKNMIPHNKYAVLNPGSVWPTKCWPEEYFSKLAVMLKNDGFHCVLTGGGAEQELCRRIAEKTGAQSIAGVASLSESASVISRAAVMVTNDSAPLHIASAFNVPVIGIFGPTVKEFGFYPYNENASMLSVSELKCRPCGMHGHESCPEGHFLCMRLIKPEQVYNEIKLRI